MTAGAQWEAGGRVFDGTWSAASFRIWQLGKVLKRHKRREMAERVSLLLLDISEACRRGAKAENHRLCLALSRRGKGAKNRRFGHINASAPSLTEFNK